jgi:hypothetical protein
VFANGMMFFYESIHSCKREWLNCIIWHGSPCTDEGIRLTLIQVLPLSQITLPNQWTLETIILQPKMENNANDDLIYISQRSDDTINISFEPFCIILWGISYENVVKWHIVGSPKSISTNSFPATYQRSRFSKFIEEIKKKIQIED